MSGFIMSNTLGIFEHATAQSIGRNPRFANPVVFPQK